MRNAITGRMVQSSQANHRSIVLQLGRDSYMYRARRETNFLDSSMPLTQCHVNISRALNPHVISGYIPRQLLWHLGVIRNKEYNTETNEFNPVYRPILTERAVLSTDSKYQKSGYKHQLVKYYTNSLRETEKPVG